MKISHSFRSETNSIHIGESDIQHPSSMSTMTIIDNMNVMVGAFPAGLDPETITLQVFIDGVRFVVFSGTKAEAAEFFKKFPRD